MSTTPAPKNKVPAEIVAPPEIVPYLQRAPGLECHESHRTDELYLSSEAT
jgi:hypothetical protein